MINFNNDIESSYRNLINSIETVFKTKLKEFDNITKDQIKENCNIFYNLLDDERLYLLFLNNKIKVFSSKEDNTNKLSKSLFNDNLLLKNIFNNQNEMDKLVLWDSLLNLYHSIENVNNKRSERLSDLNDKFNQIKIKLSEQVKEQILPDNINNTTTNMVSDIIGSFQGLVSDNKNPFENIMDITTKISEKYYKDIEDGNIEVDKLLQNIPFPGKEKGMNMEEVMGNMMGGEGMGEMMKGMMGGEGMEGMGEMMKGMMGGEGMEGMGEMMKGMMGGEGMEGMMKGMMGQKEEKEPTIIDENFSTANVEVGDDEIEKKGKGMIGNMMNMANNMPKLDGMPGLGELGDMMKNLTSNDGEVDLDNLNDMKGKMDSFMEKTLGVDISEFNEKMENLVSKIEEKNENENTVESSGENNTCNNNSHIDLNAVD
jgi:hypothetical protein